MAAVTDREFQLVLDAIGRVDTALKDHIAREDRALERVQEAIENVREQIVGLQMWKSKAVGAGAASAGFMTILFEGVKALFR
jgi:hypothetical protein